MQNRRHLLGGDVAQEAEHTDAPKALEKGLFPRGHNMVSEYQGQDYQYDEVL